jgi:hypothetical protein
VEKRDPTRISFQTKDVILRSLFPLLQFLCEFNDQGDAKWIVIRGPLRGHNDTPFGRSTIGHPGVGRL